jgi:flagellar hook-associated protein FlgK
MEYDANVTETGRNKLRTLWSQMADLVSKGNYVSEKMLKLLPEDALKKRDKYLSNLKQIVSVMYTVTNLKTTLLYARL